MKHKLLSSMIAGLLASTPLYAETSAAPADVPKSTAVELMVLAGAEQSEVAPATLVEKGMETLLSFMSQEQKPDKDLLMAFLDKEVVPFFDFAYMAKSAAGPMYKLMEPEQQVRMADNIKQQFLATMVQRLEGYGSQQVKVMSQRYGRRGYTAKVSVAVLQPQGYPARLDFRFYRAKSGWKVFDVSANGQSAVIHYRRQFRHMMYNTRYERRGYEGQHHMHRSFRNPTSQ